MDFAPGANGVLYVVNRGAEELGQRISKCTTDHKFLGQFGGFGSGDGQFIWPTSIDLDRDENLYVADWKNSRVQKFSPAGAFLATFDGTEAGVGEIRRPTGVAVDADGDVYVTDWFHHRLQVFGPDGTFVTSLVGDAQQLSPWAQTYVEANPDILKARRRVNLEPEWRFRRPVAVNVDAEGRIFVLEAARHRIQVYNKVKEFEDAALNL
jgi:DNA-binding beta-propeller fold protein YncE